MDAIYIPHLLKAHERTETLTIDGFVPDLDSLTPARGQLWVRHCTTYLEVSARVETIVTLTCHRCLAHYNQRLALDTQELIWLREEELLTPLELEISPEDLAESLPAQGHFQPLAWLYEQFCLLLPLQQICRDDCPGITPARTVSEPLIDRRWAGLEALRQQLE